MSGTAGSPANAGVRFATLGGTSSTQLSGTPTNVRAVTAFGGQLYVSSASGTFLGVSTVGSGLPTTSGQTTTLLSGFPTSGSPSTYQFVFKDADTLYVADGRNSVAGGLQKWTQSGGTWTLAYTLTPTNAGGTGTVGLVGLTGDFSGGNPVLYGTTTETSINRIVKLTDTGAGSTFTLVATAAPGTVFRGIAFAPVAAGSPNNPPENNLPSTFSVLEDTPTVFSGISVSDPDAAGADVVTVISVPTGKGTFQVNENVTNGLTGTEISGNGTPIVTLTGSIAQINATLGHATGLTFTPAANTHGNVTLTMNTNDQGNTGSGGAEDDEDTATIDVDPVADDASVTNATTDEDEQTTSGLVITRSGNDGTEVTHVKITNIRNGRVFKNDGTTEITAASPFITYDEANAGLKFTPAADFIGNATFDLQAATSAQDSGLGGGVVTATISVSPVNDAPTVNGSFQFSTVEDTAFPVTGISIGDVDAGTADILLRLGFFGTFNVSATVPGGLTASDIANNGTSIVTLTGSLAEINATLADANGVASTPGQDLTGEEIFYFQVEDLGSSGSGGPQSYTQPLTVTIDPVNDAPLIYIGTQLEIVEDTPYAFLGDLSITVLDPDIETGAEPFEIALSTTNGVAELLDTTGVTVTGNGTNNLVFSGAYTDVVAANGTLVFTPTPDFFGSATLTILARDLGSSGTGSPLTATETIDIEVTPANDAPNATEDLLTSVAEDSDARTIPIGTLTANDDAGPANESGQTLSIPSVSNVVGGSINIVGTDLIFSPTANFHGVASFDYLVQDNGTTNGSADFKTATGHVTFTINSVNDQPVLNTLGTPMLPYIPVRSKVLSAGTIAGALLSDLTENISDADADAKGIAVTRFDNATRGLWEYNLAFNPATPTTGWVAIPAGVSASNGLLLADDGDTRVRFTPNLSPKFIGFASLTFKAWDRSNSPLVEGNVDTNLTSTAYSTADDQAWIAVGTTKPAVDPDGRTILKPALPVFPPRTVTPRALAPVLVKNIVGIAGLEAGAMPVGGFGVALVSADTTDGMWRYYQASTKTWIALDANMGLSETNALLLKPTDKLQFTPTLAASGAAPLMFKTWDLASGAASGSRANTVTGSGFGAEPGTAVLDLIPRLNLSAPGVLNPPSGVDLITNEVAFSSLMSASRVVGTNLGVAVTATAGTKGRGEWEYSLDGTNWTPIGTRSRGRALFLEDSTLVRFNAVAGATPGSASLSFKAWDMTKVAPGTVAAAAGSSVSRETEIVSVAIGNTAPTLITIPVVTLKSIKASAPAGAGTPVSTLLGGAFDDVNSKVLKGIAITGFTDNGGGKWQYSVRAGVWDDLGPVGLNSAVLLASTAKVRYYVTNVAMTSGDATLSYKAWDRTTGQSGDRGVDTTGVLNSFSTAVELATITVTA